MKPGVFITFDVECSMGGAWKDSSLKPVPPRLGMMGDYGGRALGIPMICDILSRCGVNATFFLEPFNDELGHPGETEPVCRFLADNGQDVQLHVHPNHVHYGMQAKGVSFKRTDNMADLPPDRQTEMINLGAERIAKWTGEKPMAFRAGNMAASEETLKAMETTDIWMDSSYTFPYAGGQCRFSPDKLFNGSRWYGNVLETALSGFLQPDVPGLHRAKPVDLMGISFEECRDAVKMICDAGADAVVILHSFSLFKVRDLQYNGGRVNRVVKRRFERFCKWLGENRENYPARTFTELGRMVRENGYEPKAAEPCTINRPLRALTRKMVQALNNFYWF